MPLGVLVATFALFSLNMLGGGDAKLMAAGALWMGAEHIIEFVAFVTIFGGVLSSRHSRLSKGGSCATPCLARMGASAYTRAGGPIPYGIAIAAAGLMLFPATELFRTLMV